MSHPVSDQNNAAAANALCDPKADVLQDPRFFEPISSVAEQQTLFREHVKKVVLESSSFCNRKCHYCPNSFRTEKRPMDEALLHGIISQLQEIEFDQQIILHLYNEPLAMADNLIAYVADIRARLPKTFIYFSTNGDYLTLDRMRRLAQAGLSAMTVSVHPGKNFRDEVLLNRFAALARRLETSLQFTSYEEGVAIFANADVQGVPVKIRAVDFTRRGSNRGGLMTGVDAPEDRQDPCRLPFELLNVGYDGTVLPCYNILAGVDAHAGHAITRLAPGDSIFQAFCHPRLQQWRRRLFVQGPKAPPCNSCRLDFEKIDPATQEARAAFLARLPAEPS